MAISSALVADDDYLVRISWSYYALGSAGLEKLRAEHPVDMYYMNWLTLDAWRMMNLGYRALHALKHAHSMGHRNVTFEDVLRAIIRDAFRSGDWRTQFDSPECSAVMVQFAQYY